MIRGLSGERSRWQLHKEHRGDGVMSVSLPTVQQLERLPLRAVVAYAARTARRLSSELRGVVADQILDDVLKSVELVSTTDMVNVVDKAAIIRAAERVAAAYADAPENLKSLKRFRIVFSLGHAAEAALFVLLAAADPKRAGQNRKLAAEEAYHAVRAIRVLGSNAARDALKAARRDYNVLLRKYGEYEEVVLGEPVAYSHAE